MRRRSTVRAQTDLVVDLIADGVMFPCRAVDISTDGAVVECHPRFLERAPRMLQWLRIHVPNEPALMLLARPAWRVGRSQAYRFVKVDELDRLTLAEAMDASARRGFALH